jgi:hypothetical protein
MPQRHSEKLRQLLGLHRVRHLREPVAMTSAKLSPGDNAALHRELEQLLDKRPRDLRTKLDSFSPYAWNSFGRLPLDPILGLNAMHLDDRPALIERAIERLLMTIGAAADEADRQAEAATQRKGAAQ